MTQSPMNKLQKHMKVCNGCRVLHHDYLSSTWSITYNTMSSVIMWRFYVCVGGTQAPQTSANPPSLPKKFHNLLAFLGLHWGHPNCYVGRCTTPARWTKVLSTDIVFFSSGLIPLVTTQHNHHLDSNPFSRTHSSSRLHSKTYFYTIIPLFS